MPAKRLTFSKKQFQDQLNFLSLKRMPIPKGAENCLLGKTFVITDALPALTGSQAKELIEKYGGILKSNITQQTDILILGRGETDSKNLQEAEKNGNLIIDQEVFFSFISVSYPDNSLSSAILPEISEYIAKKKQLQNYILEFLDDSQNSEENFQILLNEVTDQKISESKTNLTETLHLISIISDNYYHFPDFFPKVEKILLIFKEEIKKKYSDLEIFNIFESNKKILLFLINEKLLNFNEIIVKRIINNDKYIHDFYIEYFQPEIQPFMNEKWFPKYENSKEEEDYDSDGPNDEDLKNIELVENLKKELPDNFYENRKIGENENEICKLIQKDLIEEFITYVNRQNYYLGSIIPQSIYETNSLLLEKNKELEIIQYAAFFGSIQIFKYLISNNVHLMPSLWLYAIHGKDAEMIHILEEKKIQNLYHYNCLFDAIKCHHNDVANYFINNYFEDEEKINSNILYIRNCLQYYNFAFIQENLLKKSYFHYLCKYGYYNIVKIYLTNTNVDVNKGEITIFFFKFNY